MIETLLFIFGGFVVYLYKSYRQRQVYREAYEAGMRDENFIWQATQLRAKVDLGVKVTPYDRL